MNHKPRQLSGGEVQRVGLACALAHKPILLLADEPTGELDSKTAGELLRYFKHLNETHGITAVMVTHDCDVAKATDRLIQIVDGRISGYSTTKNLKTISDMHHVYLDRYGSLQLPRHILEKLDLPQAVECLQHNDVLRGLGPGKTRRSRRIDSESREKWKDNLTRQQANDIWDIVGDFMETLGC